MSKEIIEVIKSVGKKYPEIPYNLVIAMGMIESSLKPQAKAPTSSALGLFQFLNRTWLSMVNKYGDEVGISKDLSMNTILDLRKDPKLSTEMMYRLVLENKAILKTVNPVHLYLAHFLGPSVASKFIRAYKATPKDIASKFLPRESKANPGVFRTKEGKERTVEEIYTLFSNKLSKAADTAYRIAKLPPEKLS